ncbi:MAG: DnaJ domain-containing protein [Chloroflexota bacterium]|nr:DnaJ domain-containing protein [Chloroflexota bacterium]
MTTSSRPNSVAPARDPYAVLGVDRGSGDAAIKRAYFQKVRQFPPESEPEKFQEIRAAYESIRTPERRAQTDLFLLQSPPEMPSRRSPSFDLTVHSEDIVRLALEVALGRLSIEDDYREPTLPK